MLVIFGLILVALIAIVGGDRGVMSLIALLSAFTAVLITIFILFFAIGIDCFYFTL